MFKVEVDNIEQFFDAASGDLPGKIFNLQRLDTISLPDDYIQAIDKLRVTNGTYKTTSSNRFDDINTALLRLLDDKRYSIHDLAVSDGTTSLELLEFLNKNQIEVDLLISDKYSKFVVYQSRVGKKYFDIEGELMYGTVFGLVADRRLTNRYFISRILGYILPYLPKGRKASSVFLFNPLVRKAISENKVRFGELDIFSAADMKGPFDIIRCMNVLNRSYFSDDKILEALRNIRHGLQENSILIIGRTDIATRVNFATIFRHSEFGLTAVEEINGGTEIADLVYTVFGKR